jgi:hypothetical protein
MTVAEPGGSDVKPESDIYTALVMVATGFLIIGTVFVGWRSLDLFGNWLPFGF